MENYLHRTCGKFSKGMKQKVCFARAIVHNPQVMLFDEPTSGLDLTAAEEVLDFIKQVKAQGKAVVLSSHDMAEVTELCDRISIIDKGIIKASGTIPKLLLEYSRYMFMPVINVVAVIKMLLSGYVNYGYFLIAAGVNALLLSAAVYITLKMFSKESLISRG